MKKDSLVKKTMKIHKVNCSTLILIYPVLAKDKAEAEAEGEEEDVLAINSETTPKSLVTDVTNLDIMRLIVQIVSSSSLQIRKQKKAKKTIVKRQNHLWYMKWYI